MAKQLSYNAQHQIDANPPGNQESYPNGEGAGNADFQRQRQQGLERAEQARKAQIGIGGKSGTDRTPAGNWNLPCSTRPPLPRRGGK